MHELQKASLSPRELTDLSSLRHVTSTGMVLSEALFEWFYDTGFPSNVQLANISGGTDLAACFGISNPLNPVYVGGCQGPALGIKVEVYDSTIENKEGKDVPVQGKPVAHGVPGELVATASFPNQPITFWGQGGFEKYQAAYFHRFSNVWAHGDFIMYHPVTGQILFLGRADGVLNPSGVRFGSAEIYSVIEEGFPEIADSICVGQRRDGIDSDERVILFLKMKEGKKYTETLVERVKEAIGKERSKRHVPKYVFECFDIPVSLSPSFSYSRHERANLTNSSPKDNRQPQESRTPRQADRLGPHHQTLRHAAEPAEPGLLLPVCEGGGCDCQAGGGEEREGQE